MYHPLLPVSNDKDDPAVYADLTMLERSQAAKGVRDSMMRYTVSKLQITRMPFSQRHTIRIAHRLQKPLQKDRKLISVHLTLMLCNFYLDLQMTLTFLISFSGIQAYRGNREVKYVSFSLDLDTLTLILKCDLDIIKMYL